MAKRTITMYTCDICGASSESDYGFIKLKLPVLENKEFSFWDISRYDDDEDICDCCNECNKKIANTMAKTFVYYDLAEEAIFRNK